MKVDHEGDGSNRSVLLGDPRSVLPPGRHRLAFYRREALDELDDRSSELDEVLAFQSQVIGLAQIVSP